ncbi:hypothetical protein RHGRI_005101 [Rhododendron griersonianum]|uniref:Geranyl diphosphate synthase n=1 Tax=Rhododendron griersonianum TaxID=479676 RepID=A0AAV6LB00_9ERIC|nr:hypothetical protein RHGRI_005101 [Rhododendron griersonianum]
MVSLVLLSSQQLLELRGQFSHFRFSGIQKSDYFCCSMEYYLQKTYYKTASLISNSCKAIALLAGQTTEVSMLAYEYGKNLGLAFQLIDDILDFTGTSTSLGKGSLSDIRHVPYKVVKLAAFTRDLLKNTPLGWEDGGKQQKKFESLPRTYSLPHKPC